MKSLYILFLALLLSTSAASFADAAEEAAEKTGTFTFFSQEKFSWPTDGYSPQQKLYRWIDSHWTQHSNATNFPPHPIEIALTLSRDSNLASYRFVRSSGMAKIDRSVIDMVRRCSPIDRPPCDQPYENGLRMRFHRGGIEAYVPRQAPIKVLIFSGGPLRHGRCIMGLAAKEIQKLQMQDEKESTLNYWKEVNTQKTGERFKDIFKKDPVSFLVTFEGTDNVGTLHPLSPQSEVANRAAIKLLELHPFPYCPSKQAIYEGGLLVRFDSQKVTISPAPQGRMRKLLADERDGGVQPKKPSGEDQTN